MSKQLELPVTTEHVPGWAWAHLGDFLLRIEAGKSFKCEERPPRKNEVGVVKVSAVTWGHYQEQQSKTCQRENLIRPELFIRPGDFLFSRANTIELVGACVIASKVNRNVMLSDKILRFHFSEIDPRWVLWWLRSIDGRAQIMELATGNQDSMRNIGQARIRQINIPVCSARERAAIVEQVETQLSKTDAAIAGLKRVQANLKRYRASVLKAAVEGRLVPTEAELARQEGRDYEPASVLLAGILAERRCRWEEAELAKMKAKGKTPKNDKWKAKYKEPVAPDTEGLPELPEGWCWTTVDAVGDVLLGRRRAPEYTGELRPYLRVANVRDNHIDFTEIKTMPFDERHFSSYQVRAGDILVSEGQSPELIGQSAVYRGGVAGLCFQSTLHRFRVIDTNLQTEYCQLVFRSHVKNGTFRKYASVTTNIAHLVLRNFKRVPMPIPPPAEQTRIVEEAERLLSVSDATDTQLRVEFARLKKLRQSILKWAFEGKLVDQDPNDEPASVLLERIRAEREAATQAKTSKKKPTRKRRKKKASSK